ncbi:hypothetical protein HPB49_011596 [Dermacentor silvarum]|uniref:Uncharacterized protein n=1 Tax=Dermacentor silvarum TaxID=543639 RepID=A0ACB8D4X8_DERSI|nr:hypothetical protein HPB49_011596 [Dermacentor silvarum]
METPQKPLQDDNRATASSSPKERFEPPSSPKPHITGAQRGAGMASEQAPLRPPSQPESLVADVLSFEAADNAVSFRNVLRGNPMLSDARCDPLGTPIGQSVRPTAPYDPSSASPFTAQLLRRSAEQESSRSAGDCDPLSGLSWPGKPPCRSTVGRPPMGSHDVYPPFAGPLGPRAGTSQQAPCDPRPEQSPLHTTAAQLLSSLVEMAQSQASVRPPVVDPCPPRPALSRPVVQGSSSAASTSSLVLSRPSLPQPGSRLPSRCHVATWTFQSGSEAPICFVSAKRWKEKRKVESGMSELETPRVFRGRTVSAMVEDSGGAAMAPDPSAAYCEMCGVLCLCRAHDASKVHKVYAKKTEPAAGESGTDPAVQEPKKTDPDVNEALLRSVVGALASDPAFAATIAAAVQ